MTYADMSAFNLYDYGQANSLALYQEVNLAGSVRHLHPGQTKVDHGKRSVDGVDRRWYRAKQIKKVPLAQTI